MVVCARWSCHDGIGGNAQLMQRFSVRSELWPEERKGGLEQISNPSSDLLCGSGNSSPPSLSACFPLCSTRFLLQHAHGHSKFLPKHVVMKPCFTCGLQSCPSPSPHELLPAQALAAVMEEGCPFLPACGCQRSPPTWTFSLFCHQAWVLLSAPGCSSLMYFWH